MNWPAGRFGKWSVFAGSLLASAVVMPGLMLIGPWFPIPLVTQGIIWVIFQSIAMSGITMLPQAFAAEVTGTMTKNRPVNDGKVPTIHPGFCLGN